MFNTDTVSGRLARVALGFVGLVAAAVWLPLLLALTEHSVADVNGGMVTAVFASLVWTMLGAAAVVIIRALGRWVIRGSNS